jgi:DNA replication initiation complex subunit (GINS family)
VFKEEVPAFVGADMRSYGPFKKGDIAKLPEENKLVLLQQGIVDEFTINK